MGFIKIPKIKQQNSGEPQAPQGDPTQLTIADIFDLGGGGGTGSGTGSGGRLTPSQRQAIRDQKKAIKKAFKKQQKKDQKDAQRIRARANKKTQQQAQRTRARADKKAQQQAKKNAKKHSFDGTSINNNTPYIIGGTIATLFLVNKFL